MVKITNKLLSGIAFGALCVASAVQAAEIDTNIAQMQAMDKITGRVSVIDVPVNGSVNFGSFSIVVRACKTRPPEDTPENFAFVDVVDNYKTETPVNIFRGWMISSSPALNPVEHPIYDVWLLKCINGTVNPSKLLTKEELAKRDALPKAPAFTEEAKLKANEDLEEKQAPVNEEVSETEEKELQSKEVQPTPQVLPMEETQLENLNISNPPAFEQDIPQPEPIVQEDGAPKSLLNIGNDFVPQEQSEASKADTVNSSEPVVSETKTLEAEEKQIAAEPVEEPSKKEDEASGFLGKFLSFGNEEKPAAEVPDVSEPSQAPDADNNVVQEETSNSSIDMDEIDRELMQMQ